MRLLLWLALTAAAVGGLWWWLKPGPVTTLAPPDSQSVLEARFVVADGAMREGPKGLAVQQGTPLRIIVESDRVDELHVHGYDLTADMAPGRPGRLEFVADEAGRFELELHAQHLSLGYLVVTPR